MPEKWGDGFREAGRKYDYPECCIEHFVARIKAWEQNMEPGGPWPDDVALHPIDHRIMCPVCQREANAKA